MKIGITGSRGINLDLRDIELNSGGAIGVDQFFEALAHQLGIKVNIFRPKNPSIKHDYLKRNEEIVDNSDIVIAVWDGKSKGTKFTIDYANEQKKPLILIEV